MNSSETQNIILSSLPDYKRIEIENELKKAGNDKKKRMKVISELNKHRKFIKERAEIPWNPVINPDKCTGCRVCYNFCPKGVFGYDGIKKKVNVKYPEKCVFLCKGCIPKCKYDAISFPERKDFIELFYYEFD